MVGHACCGTVAAPGITLQGQDIQQRGKLVRKACGLVCSQEDVNVSAQMTEGASITMSTTANMRIGAEQRILSPDLS